MCGTARVCYGAIGGRWGRLEGGFREKASRRWGVAGSGKNADGGNQRRKVGMHEVRRAMRAQVVLGAAVGGCCAGEGPQVHWVLFHARTIIHID